MSYFLEVSEAEAAAGAAIIAGPRSADAPLCRCPNCQEPMFPVFSIHRSVNGMPDLPIYDSDGFLTLDVCGSCSHGLRNYYTRLEGDGRVACLGYSDQAGPVNFLDKPFESRHVELVPVAEEDWERDEFVDAFDHRELLQGVLHQLGGRKMKEERNPLTQCLCCGSALSYLGTVDNDDLNMPLSEAGSPIALVIGDAQGLNVFTCASCNAINYGITF